MFIASSTSNLYDSRVTFNYIDNNVQKNPQKTNKQTQRHIDKVHKQKRGTKIQKHCLGKQFVDLR